MVTISWRTGANLRELAFYGARGPLNASEVVKGSNRDYTQQQLRSLQNLGVQVIRFYAAHQWFSSEEVVQLVGKTLDTLAQFDMQAVICLNDSLGTTLLNVAGDEPYHSQVHGHLRGDYWTDKAYRQFYMPHIRKLVTAFKTHKAVLIWELGNEYGIYPDPARANQVTAFFEFVRDSSAAIKAIDPHHLISIGLTNSHHIESSGADVKTFARQIYGLPSVDAISIHDYAEFSHDQAAFNRIDAEVARLLGKPVYVGEIGATWQIDDRPRFYRESITEWKDRLGASMVMPWAFDDVERPHPGVTDLGISDTRGMSRQYADFDTLKEIVRGFRGRHPSMTLIPTSLLSRILAILHDLFIRKPK